MPFVESDVDESVWEADEEGLLESFLEEEEKWETEADYEPETYDTEAVRKFRIAAKPQLVQSLRRATRPVKLQRGVQGLKVRTPAGMASIRADKPLATIPGVNKLVIELKKEISALASAIKKVNTDLDKNTAILDKKINATNASVTGTQMQVLLMGALSSLIPTSKPRELATVTLLEKPNADGSTPVSAQTFKEPTTGESLLTYAPSLVPLIWKTTAKDYRPPDYLPILLAGALLIYEKWSKSTTPATTT